MNGHYGKSYYDTEMMVYKALSIKMVYLTREKLSVVITADMNSITSVYTVHTVLT